MLGKSAYERIARDHYPTPKRSVDALVSAIADDLSGMAVWEPFAGNGAFSKVLAPLAREIISTDIFEYEGFKLDAVQDFFAIYPDGPEYEKAAAAYPNALVDYTELLHTWHHAAEDARGEEPTKPSLPVPFSTICAINDFVPDTIISNPPYGLLAEQAIRHALKLMEKPRGDVIFFMRADYDSSKRRADIFDHLAFATKIVLRHRPRWIEDSTGAPRFNYAFYHWSWSRPAFEHPRIMYVA